MTPQPDRPALISAEDLARMLGVSKRTLWRLLSAQRMPRPVRLGGSTRWRLDVIRAWIERGCPPPGDDEDGLTRSSAPAS